MLSISAARGSRTCAGMSRRELLRVGALGLGGMTLGGLSLSNMLATKALGSTQNIWMRDRAVVLLFLHGGPPHIEFFDPKMTAPAEIRSITGEVKTKTPGVTFGGTFPRLASMSDKISVVRSYGSGQSDHTYLQVASGGNKMKAAMSAVYARVAGANHAQTGLPRNVIVKPEAVQEGLKLKPNFETGALPTVVEPGTLGPSFGAFDPSGGGTLRQNMEMKLPVERLSDRKNLLGQLDGIRRQVDASGKMHGSDKFQQQAFDVITRGVSEAFDVSKEDPATIKRYDTSGVCKLEELTRWYDMTRATNLLGRQMLLARRLVERGCGFVTVSDCGWDFHANENSPKGMTAMIPKGHQVDQAVAAFIEDCQERGLADKVVLAVTGEMGRTPRINGGGGRDHYGELTPLLLWGGGLKMGRVVGQSDDKAHRAVGRPYRPENMFATIFQRLFDLGQMRLDPSIPRDVWEAISSAEPIVELTT